MAVSPEGRMMGYSKSVFKYNGGGNSSPILLKTVRSRIRQIHEKTYKFKLSYKFLKFRC